MAFGHLLLCNWLPAFYSSSFPCSDFFRLFFKVVLSLAHSGDEEEAYHQRAMPEGPTKEERGRRQRSLSLRLFYILVDAIVVALSPAARDAPRNGGNGKGRRGGKWDPCVFLAQQRDDGTTRAMWDGCLSVARRSRSVERRPFRCRGAAGASRSLARSLGVQCGNKI